MNMKLPVSEKPAKVNKTGGSMRLTIPPAFFVVAGIDRNQDLEADVFYDGENLVARIREVHSQKDG